MQTSSRASLLGNLSILYTLGDEGVPVQQVLDKVGICDLSTRVVWIDRVHSESLDMDVVV